MDFEEETKQERRQKRLEKKREKMLQHGKSIVRVYRDAILKRLKRKGDSDDQSKL